MTDLDTKFTEELLANIDLARDLTGLDDPQLTSRARKYGGAAAVKELLRRGQYSRQFDLLQKKGRLDLSPEHLATRGKYGPLFSDGEVDQCLSALLEAGAFHL